MSNHTFAWLVAGWCALSLVGGLGFWLVVTARREDAELLLDEAAIERVGSCRNAQSTDRDGQQQADADEAVSHTKVVSHVG